MALPTSIFRRWTHSYEEDSQGIIVYRPRERALPPARGRDGLELEPGGGVVFYDVGPADAQRGVRGQWREAAPGYLLMTFADPRPARAFQIIEVGNDILRLREVAVNEIAGAPRPETDAAPGADAWIDHGSDTGMPGAGSMEPVATPPVATPPVSTPPVFTPPVVIDVPSGGPAIDHGSDGGGTTGISGMNVQSDVAMPGVPGLNGHAGAMQGGGDAMPGGAGMGDGDRGDAMPGGAAMGDGDRGDAMPGGAAMGDGDRGDAMPGGGGMTGGDSGGRGMGSAMERDDSIRRRQADMASPSAPGPSYRFAVLRGEAAISATARAPRPSVASYCQFLDETVVWAPDAAWDRIEPELGAAARGADPARSAQGELYLVVQMGDLFLRANPWVRVIVNKGRHLAIDLTEAEFARVADTCGACWGIRPLPRNEVVVERARSQERAPEPWVAALVGAISLPSYTAYLTSLASRPTRHSLSTHFRAAADWAAAELRAMGYQVELRPITVGSGTSSNVVADRVGGGASRGLVIVTAHLDSINIAGGPTAPAPGADDNGSGAAGVLEIGRVLASHPIEHDLRLILFGGEEEGLFGSRQYVAGLSAAERSRVRAVINMDMIATLNNAAPGVLLEGAPVSQALMNDLASAASAFTSLVVQTSLHPFASDHVPFIDAAVPAVLTIEGNDTSNTNIHSANDTLSTIHYPLALQILKMNVATAATRLGRLGTARATSSSPIVSRADRRLDLFVIGTDRAVYHKAWNDSSWSPVTGYERLGGICLGDAQVVSWGPSRLDAFVIGTDSALYHKWWNGSSWGPSPTGFESLGGVCQGEPRIASWGPDRLDAFVVGTDRALYHKWWNGSSWGPSATGFESLGGVCVSSPEVVSWGPNRLDVFVIGADRALYHKAWNGSSWGPSATGWERLGGVCMRGPRAVSWGPDRLDVFVVGTDGALYHKWWNGSSWGPSTTGWERMGGICAGAPEAVSWGPNRLDLFVIGTDSALYHKWWDGSAWGPSLTGYERMGGVCIEGPRAAAWAPNRLDVFVTGTDSALYHKWWDGSAWGPSLTGYERMGGIITKL